MKKHSKDIKHFFFRNSKTEVKNLKSVQNQAVQRNSVQQKIHHTQNVHVGQ